MTNKDKDDKDDKKDHKKNKNTDDNSEAINGKINKVPYKAILAYLDKYKGIGRFENKYKDKMKTDISDKEEIYEDDKSEDNRTSKKNLKRRGGVFYPTNEEPYFESLSNGNSYDDYYSNYSNILTNETSNVEELKLLGDNKVNLLQVEIDICNSVKTSIDLKNIATILSDRIRFLKEANEDANVETDDLQPGTFEHSAVLRAFLENLTDQSNLDFSGHLDSIINTAITKRKYYDSYIKQFINCLESNVHFDMQFAKDFTNKYCAFFINYVNASNIDFILDATAQCRSDIEVVNSFINQLIFNLEIKSEQLVRIIDFDTINGTTSVYQDSQLARVLEMVDRLDSSIDSYKIALESLMHGITNLNSKLNILSGSGISKNNLLSVRSKLIKNKIKSNHNLKFGGTVGQVMSDVPNNTEVELLQIQADLQDFSGLETQLRSLKLGLIADFEYAKTVFETCPHIITGHYDEFLKYLKSTLPHMQPTFNSLDTLSGADVWQAEFNTMLNSIYDFEVDKKAIMCVSYLNAKKILEQRIFNIINGLMRRIGIDPLAPRIITNEMSRIFSDLGYHCKADTGLQQAKEELELKMKYTENLEIDLFVIIEELEKGNQLTAAMDDLLDSIIGDFAGVQLDRPLDENQKELLEGYVCPSCNKIYGSTSSHIPLKLSCGDTQCLSCSCSTRTCFVCKTECENVPTMPQLYNPSIHAPLDFIAASKLDFPGIGTFMTNFLLTNKATFSGIKPQDYSVLLHLIELENILLLEKCNKKTDKIKIENFITDLKQCTTCSQFDKIVIKMIDNSSLETIIKLVQLAKTMVEFYSTKENQAILMNVVTAIVAAAKVPMQALATLAIYNRDITAVFDYCSAENLTFIETLLTSKRNFTTTSHYFQYASIAPLALIVTEKTIDYLKDEDIITVLDHFKRTYLLNELEALHAKIQNYLRGKNYTLIEHEIKNLTSLFFNELAVYATAYSSIDESAKVKTTQLFNLYNNDIMQNITKKYPEAKNIQCDDALIDLKYAEVIISDIKERMQGMYDFTINESSDAIDKQLMDTELQTLNGIVQMSRSKLSYPGVYVDFPTNNSASKGIYPIVCAVNQDNLGNNPALPLYQYSMGEMAVLDTGASNVPKEMELAHTEGPLFYTGYDGFLEEYLPQTFDPVVKELSGQLLPAERIIPKTEIFSDIGIAGRSRSGKNRPLSGLALIDQLKMLSEQASAKKAFAEKYAGETIKQVLKNPLIKSSIFSLFTSLGVPHFLLPSIMDVGDYLAEKSSSSLQPYFQDLIENAYKNQKIKGSGITTELSEPAKKINKFQNYKIKLLNTIQNRVKDHLQNKLNVDKVIEPILKFGGAIKSENDNVDDDNEDDFESEDECDNSPNCGHCNSKTDLKGTTCCEEPEFICSGCYEGKGITKANRKIVSKENTEDLATTNHPKLLKAATKYRNYFNNLYGSGINKKKNSINYEPANTNWEKFKNSAISYFPRYPDEMITHYMTNKISHKLEGMGIDNIKKKAILIGGKLGTMLNVEKKNMPREFYNNLKHNFIWHVAHLPCDNKLKGGQINMPNDFDFEKMYDNEETINNLHTLAQVYV